MSPTPTRAVAAAALAALPSMHADRQRAVIAYFGDPIAALAGVRARCPLDVLAHEDSREAVRRAAIREWANTPLDLDVLAATLDRRGTRVWVDGDDDFPIRDPVAHQPCVLLGEGDRMEALDAPRVAIVGTRAATPHGLTDAREVARFLAEAGCAIVSGLALGIDAAAHEGALEVGGRVIGVIGTGLDVVYPRQHARLYAEVRAHGVLISEFGYGTPADKWRFPHRNRVIAVLADVVVVIEATLTGGARITAGHAVDYERPLFALPGSRRNVAAAGCNQLLTEGAAPLLDPSDVLGELQLAAGGELRAWDPAKEQPPSRDAASVLHALGGDPASVDQLGARTRLLPERLGPALRELEKLRRVQFRRGRYWPV